ncbi:MAG: 16S rRNA (guanine(966)-N(2))-methyltransferase RsmD [Rickettsiales bacterium]|nr:16S rRNA (guanine(966)-N(2))-methyltransferase RsmD [Rickettsiales bacterium]
MMQIIAGKHRGRKLETPQSYEIRPTGARAREAIFNIVAHTPHPEGPMLDGAIVADICCGSGAMGLEALSRGAAHAYFIDQSREALTLVRQSAEKFREEAHCTFLRTEAKALPPAPTACRVLFIDPPYRKDLLPAILQSVLLKGWLTEDGMIVAEMSVKDPFTCPDALDVITDRTYANTRVVILRHRSLA